MTVHRLPRRTLPRRLVLAAAVVAGVAAAAALAPRDAGGIPGGTTAVLERIVVADALAQAAPAPPAPPATLSAPPLPPPPGANAGTPPVNAEITIDERGVRVRKGGAATSDEKIVLGDHEFDSFEEFVERAPWIAAIVLGVTALVFITPVLLIALIVWYKVRRTRMLNETMLKLAERGVVPPSEAMEAIATGRAPPVVDGAATAGPATPPVYAQAKAIRQRAAWSDLRKGVLIGGVGLGLTFWSMINDGSANGFGLILLFVGIGYTILWYFEERPGRTGHDGSGAKPPGGA